MGSRDTAAQLVLLNVAMFAACRPGWVSHSCHTPATSRRKLEPCAGPSWRELMLPAHEQGHFEGEVGVPTGPQGLLTF